MHPNLSQPVGVLHIKETGCLESIRFLRTVMTLWLSPPGTRGSQDVTQFRCIVLWERLSAAIIVAKCHSHKKEPSKP